MSRVWDRYGCRGLIAGTITLLLTSFVAAGVLLLTLPVRPAGAWHLPLLLAAAALGGRIHVDGPAAGHVSALGPGGLLGPAQAPDDLARHLAITAMPLTLTVLTALAIGFALRRAGVAAVGWTVAGFAAVGLLVALAARTGAVSAGPVSTAVGAAAVAAVSGILALLLDHPAVRAGLAAAVGLLALGTPVLVVAALVERLGTVGTLLVGGQVSAGLAVTLAVLLAPALIWDVAALSLGVPQRLSGGLAGFHLDHEVTLIGAAHGMPLLVFAPVLTVAALLGVAARSRARARDYAIGLGVLGLLMYGAARFAVTPTGQAGERLAVAAPLVASVALPVVWGVVLGVVAPRLWAPRAVVREQRA